MLTLPHCGVLLVALSFPAFSIDAHAQRPQEITNPKLEDGETGKAPPGWSFSSRAGGSAALTEESPHEGSRCVCIDATQAKGKRAFSNLMQSIDATPWRGKRVRYRAWVKTAELTSGSGAQLWFRVDREEDKDGNRQIGAFDNMGDRPIRSEEWARYAIVLDVADDAKRIALGMFLTGKGKAWLDDAAIEVVDKSVKQTQSSSRRTGRTIDKRVQKALANAHKAPQQPFWTLWLALPLIAIALFLIGLWPVRRAHPDGPAPDVGHVRWFAFRFTVCYWLIYCLPGPITDFVVHVPGLGPILHAALQEWHVSFESTLSHWTAREFFDIPGELVPPNGSGDTTQGYLTILNAFVLALLVAAVWTFALGRRPNRLVMTDLLRSYLRWVLAFALLSYGLAKVSMARNQFPMLAEWRLSRTWGETSPMGAVWAFMGASRPYTIFSGLGEILGAVLLIWRPTALLGAVVAVCMMTNIAMLNYCYDVPVKIYSTHLWLMGVLIMVPDSRRLIGLLLRNKNSDDLGVPNAWSGSVQIWIRGVKLIVILVAFAIPLGNRSWELFEHFTSQPENVEQPSEASDEDDGHLLIRRGFRWINEVPFNR